MIAEPPQCPATNGYCGPVAATSMILLPLLTVWIARGRLAEAQRKELYDEPYRRMDEWLDGRRDVDLGGDRRTGGGPAGRSD